MKKATFCHKNILFYCDKLIRIKAISKSLLRKRQSVNRHW